MANKRRRNPRPTRDCADAWRRPRRLFVEQLEPRTLLTADLAGIDGSNLPALDSGASASNPIMIDLGSDAAPPGGNVTAEVIDGTLVVRGDDAGNQVIIEATGNGDFALQGINGGTTVNGQIAWPSGSSGDYLVMISGVTRGLDIDLGNGDNYLWLYGVLPDVGIHTGSGDDDIGFGSYFQLGCVVTGTFYYPGPADIQGNLFIYAGAGNDNVQPFVHVTGDATIQMGDGDDRVLEPATEQLQAAGTVSIDLGAGQADAGPPSDWHSDSALVSNISTDIIAAFGRYAAALKDEEATPGQAWAWSPDPNGSDSTPNEFTADGRLEIEFYYAAGDTELITRLKARGVEIDRYSDDHGFAYASVSEPELALFGNLPNVGNIGLRGSLYADWPAEFYSPSSATGQRVDIDVLAAVDRAAIARNTNSANDSTFIYNGDGNISIPVTVSPTGAILAIAYFAPGDTTVIDEMIARGIAIGQSFPQYGDTEVWVDQSNVETLSEIPGLIWVGMIRPFATTDPIFVPSDAPADDLSPAPTTSPNDPDVRENSPPIDVPSAPAAPPEQPPAQPVVAQPDSPATTPSPSDPVKPASPASDALVSYTLQLTNPDGLPLTSLVPGQEFILHAYTQDLRAAPLGVATAYLDVHWNSSLAIAEKGLEPDEWTWQSLPDGTTARVQSGIHHTQTYGNAKSGDTSIPGLIDHAGGFAGAAKLSAGTHEVFSVLMKATGTGNLAFTSGPPDLSTPAYLTLAYFDLNDLKDFAANGFSYSIPPSEISYGTASIAIAPAEVVNDPAPTTSPPFSTAEPKDTVATVELKTIDLSGAPITTINVGQEFQVRAYLVLVTPTGVQPVSGFADVTYNSSLIAPADNSADVGLVGSTTANGLIDEAGRAMFGDPSGLMFTKTFTATQKGTATFDANAAEGLGHEIYVVGLNGTVPWSQVTFGSTTLTIKP